MDISTLPEEDRQVLQAALYGMKVAGGPAPLIPLEVDLDGDSVADAFGLDEDDELVFVSGVKLEATGYVSEGDDWGAL